MQIAHVKRILRQVNCRKSNMYMFNVLIFDVCIHKVACAERIGAELWNPLIRLRGRDADIGGSSSYMYKPCNSIDLLFQNYRSTLIDLLLR